MEIIFKLVIIVFLLSIISCADTQIKIDPLKHYKHDIYIWSRDSEGLGVIVAPKRDVYNFSFESEGIMDFFTFTTCSRQIAIEDAHSGMKRKKVWIEYKPNDIEKTQVCPAVIRSYSESGRHAYGFIDFENDLDVLSAKLTCGEIISNNKGVSVCQGREGLINKIEFDTEVLISPDKGCDSIKSENGTWSGKGFIFNIDKGPCLTVFMEKAPPHRMHRLNTLGYSEIIIRR
jgi:hypothetical protein